MAPRPLSIWGLQARKEGRSVADFGSAGRHGMAKTNPFEFLQQVRSEGAKVTWPTRKETMITTAMVFVMVVLASVFFLVVDQVIGWGVRAILGLGG
jgi:preprotein translocase subunit SecE